MATYLELVNSIRQTTHATVTEASEASMVELLQACVRDLNAYGALQDLATDTITVVADTYAYTIPASYVWIHHLEPEDPTNAGEYNDYVPPNHWRLTLVGANPTVEFFRSMFNLPVADKKIRFIGQAKLIALAGANDTDKLATTVPVSVEGIMQQLLERKVLARLSQGRTELAADRADQRREAALFLDAALASSVGARVRPGSRRVPGR